MSVVEHAEAPQRRPTYPGRDLRGGPVHGGLRCRRWRETEWADSGLFVLVEPGVCASPAQARVQRFPSGSARATMTGSEPRWWAMATSPYLPAGSDAPYYVIFDID